MTSVSIVSNVLTVQVVNAFGVGQTILLNGLTTATFLNGQTVVVTTQNGTSFTAAFTHANYGPASDTGTAQNLLYLQEQIVFNGFLSPGTYTPTFVNAVQTGSLVLLALLTGDNNATNTFTSVVDNLGNVYTIKNNTTAGGTSLRGARM